MAGKLAKTPREFSRIRQGLGRESIRGGARRPASAGWAGDATKERPSITLTEARGPRGLAIYAVGDIHGRIDLLERMLEKIRRDMQACGAEDWRIIFLGDHVDRGPASRQVLDRLIACAADPRHVFLAGNHDSGFLDFLDRMDIRGPFLMFGGIQTAASYGIDFEWELEKAHAALQGAVPQAHIEFLRELQFSVAFGDYYFCHAGIRPKIPLARQSREDLQWIRSPFLEYEKPHPAIIVHGHTPCRSPEIRNNRINIDTGAYRSGMLTALVIEEDHRRFLQVSEAE